MRPVVTIPPIAPARPLLVEVPHAGIRIPDEIRSELALDDAAVQRDADLYVDRLYAHAPSLGATLIFTEVSRFVVDLNRADGDVDALSVPDHPAPKPTAPRGLIWRVTTNDTPTLTAPLSLASYRARVERYHAPYHAAVDRTVDELLARFGRVVVLSGHSMPSVGKAAHADPGKRRADVVPGDLRGQSCAAEITDATVEHFTRAGLTVALNNPYLGGETTRRLGRPTENIHALQVELNRDLYMDEATFAIKERGFGHLQDLCDTLVDRLATLGEHLPVR